MGYEIVYFYHERGEDGKYKTDEKKELKKRVGAAYDDVPLENAAAVILAQFARRDILVADVEIYEYTKKKLSFKECPGGVIIKNRKFSLDDAAKLVAENSEDITPPAQAPVANIPTPPPLRTPGVPIPVASPQNRQQAKAGGINLAPLAPPNPNRVIFWVVYEPSVFEIEAKRRQLHLTVGRKYPVHRKRENPEAGSFSNLYAITDDVKQIVELDDKFFSPVGAGLIGDDEVPGGFSDNSSEPKPKLMYEDQLRIDPDAAVPRRQVPARRGLEGIPAADGGVPKRSLQSPQPPSGFTATRRPQKANPERDGEYSGG